MNKKNVLFVSEASYLSTGYATYSREVLNHLHKSGKYNVAEFSIYGSPSDPRRKTIPWKNYPNLPDPGNEEQNKAYNSDPINAFGKWRFERVCLDFKPDYVCDIRDWWMSSFVQNSPYRKYFKWLWMPTVDGAPQNEEWIDSFSDADAVLTYSDWGIDVLKSQSYDINVKQSAPPAASEEFFPVENKSAHKESVGIDPSKKIIGTVMRNQRRKLFPDLFEAFSKYLKKTGCDKTYLYCHTSYPDNGWSIPKLLHKNEISSRVVFTYICEACGNVGFHKFSDSIRPCEKCGKLSSKMPSVGLGVDRKTLSSIYNLFDIYVQPASCEGFGVPIVEAAACGVPIVATDYSAMESEVRKLKGYPISLKTKYLEMETGCYRAVPDQEHMVEIFEDLLSKPEPMRLAIGAKTRKAYEENYNWKVTSEIWEKLIDEQDFSSSWDIPISLGNPNIEVKKENFNTNKELIDFLVTSMLNEPKLLNTYPMNKVLRDLNFGSFRPNPGGYFYGEMSIFNRSNPTPFSSDSVISGFRKKTEEKNFWEQARVGNVNFPKENWI